ncbi:P-loop containing nucleoside triphosphate hydrolase protein [Ilyonectria destructans]|nr:P-loop containing nucleoside triphosphate hydrolase protein [Ilyonectria destructans]
MDSSVELFILTEEPEENGRIAPHAQNISLDNVERVEINIRDLSVSVNTAPSWLKPGTYQDLLSAKFKTTPCTKQLLQSITTDLQPGKLTAIMGGSNSGKTTLLNTMAERVRSSRLSQEGRILFNGAEGVLNIKHAYVMQQDILLPTLTVRETLQYAADLRLPASTSSHDRHRVVEEIIRELGLKDCSNTRIGNSRHGGCSGGEKRRVSLGVQLLANPSVLFLDEPTTGLDATCAFQLVRTIRALAQKGRTIIMTIHQPRSEIWDLLDDLIILSRGSLVYSGSTLNCLSWFESQGFQLPSFVNPAEHLIAVTIVDNRTPTAERESGARVDMLKNAWRTESATLFPPLPRAVNPQHRKRRSNLKTRAGFLRQMRVLTSRTLKITYRDPMGMAALIMEAILMGITTGYLFFNVGHDLAGIRSREGCLYMATALQGYLILIFEVYRMTIDISTFDREFAENCVDPVPFILSRRLARMLTEDISAPLIFSALVYFMAGFDREVNKFLIFFAITLVNHYVTIMCATTCVVAVRHFATASLIANLVFTLQTLACGMFIQVNTIPIYVRWVKWITYSFYSFGAYVGNEFQSSFYDCPAPGGSSNPACLEYDGDFVIESLGLPKNWIARPIIILGCFVIFFFALSVVGLHFVKAKMRIARSRILDSSFLVENRDMILQSIGQARAIDLQLEKFALSLEKRTISWKRRSNTTILQPIDMKFPAGVLNVIIGPSGSGKTSLLNAMALRLRNSIGTRYHPAGALTFNGAVPSGSVIRSVCSYVCQEDDLLPFLTVRETLRFAAGLRLPSYMSKEDKYRRSEEILLKMGLKDCANNLIGNDMIKGISGGEKRRVSIAIQILTNPQILLLDEPTSGLDVFTASSIVEILQGLANEGRTIILTIHQARSDLFNRFGNVLLLAKGGFPVYAGSTKEMLGYFGKHGYHCPQHTNPADFVLDMITIDPQQADGGAASRRRVQQLIKSWGGHDEEIPETSYKHFSEPQGRTESTRRFSSTHEYDRGGKKTTDVESIAAHSSQPNPESINSLPLRPKTAISKINISSPAELGALVRERGILHTTFPLLLHRAIINTRRQPQLVLARTMQVIGVSIIFSLFFALRQDYFSVQNRMGFLQEIGALYFVGMLQNVAVYPNERDVFYRDDDDGIYGVDTFLAVYTILELPFEIFSSLIFGMLSVTAVGLPQTATMFFVATFSCFGLVSCGESLGIIFNTLFDHTGFAVNIMGIFLAVANGMAGILSIDMPSLLQALNYLSPIRYATRALGLFSLRGIKFTCTEDQRLASGDCPIETGEQVLELYKFDESATMNLAALAGCN